MTDQYIYILDSERDFNDINFQAIKIGSTIQPISRLSTYLTHHYNAPHVKKLYKVNYNCYMLDNMIKKQFPQYRRYGTPKAGIEFYHPDLKPEIVESYFKSSDIEFEEVDFYKLDLTNRPNNDDYDFICQEDKIKNMHNMKTPRDYQLKILKDIMEYYKNNRLGKLILPCGSGKTLITYWALDKLKYKKVLFLVPSLYLLSQVGDVFLSQSLQENKPFKHLFVGSEINLNEKLFDIDTINIFKKNLVHQNDTEKIQNFIDTNDNFIIFSTYQSSMALNKYTFDFIVFDESHKTAVQNENDTGFSNYVTNHTTSKKLFLTATEKICNLKDDDIEDIMSMDNIKLYGGIIHRMTIKKAIQVNALCDYEIVIHQDDINDLVDNEKRKELKQIYKFNKIVEYYGKAMIIKKLLQEYKATHMITKHTLVENAKVFSKILKEVLNDIDIEIYTLDGNTSMQVRKNVIKNFKKAPISIICQAKVLSEGVDIPECDSICIIDDIESTIDIIQFIGRCLRILQGKDKAYLLLPMLVDKNKDIINTRREFNNIRIILRAMLNEDDRIVQYFTSYNYENNKKNIVKATTDLINFKGNVESNLTLDVVKDINKISPETFEKARQFVKSKYFKSIKEYTKWCNERLSNFNIPKNPESIYKTLGWVNWSDWLGNKILELKDIKKLIEIENNKRIIDKEKIIDTRELYDIWAKVKDLPLCDELEEYFTVNYKWLLNIDDSKYLLWIDVNKSCKDFYKRNMGKYGSFGSDYYKQMLIEGINIPSDPNECYKDFTNYNDLFGINYIKK